MAVSSPPQVLSPGEKMCVSFSYAEKRGNGWHRVPKTAAHPKFDFLEKENGDIIIHAWNNASAESILAAGNPPLRLADLYARPGQYSRVARRDTLDLLAYAHHFKLPLDYLYSIGYSDGYRYNGKRAVKVGGYYTPDGAEHSKVKVRLSLGGDRRFAWDESTPGKPVPCGLNRLDEARTLGFLIIGEGESDAAVMWFHGVPFLGIPGASSAHLLDVSLLDGIPVVFILEEPDQARKLSATGKAFYSDLRKHLRAGGYSGAIYSIRFSQATGYKDPAMLHKELWDSCDPEEEAPFLSTIKARFASAIRAALESAIPEGNEVPTEQEEDTGLAPFLALSDIDRMSWFAGVCQVKRHIMRDGHKIAFMVMMMYGWPAGCGTYWEPDTDLLAEKAGMPKKTFLTYVRYLTDVLGLFEKDNRKQFYTVTSGRKRGQTACREQLRIKPSDHLFLLYPSTIHIQDPQKALPQWGGTPPPREEPAAASPGECENCGSRDTEPYAILCHECNHVTYPPIKDDEPEMLSEQAVESTAVALPLLEPESEKELSTCVPKLGMHVEEEKRTQLGYAYPTLDSFVPGEPCAACGCALYRPMAEYTVCIRCLPPRGYHHISDQVDALYPRTHKKPDMSLARQRERHGASPGKAPAPDVPGQLFVGV